MFNDLVEYFRIPWGVRLTNLGSMFNYPGKYVQRPWGVFSSTLVGDYWRLAEISGVLAEVSGD